MNLGPIFNLVALIVFVAILSPRVLTLWIAARQHVRRLKAFQGAIREARKSTLAKIQEAVETAKSLNLPSTAAGDASAILQPRSIINLLLHSEFSGRSGDEHGSGIVEYAKLRLRPETNAPGRMAVACTQVGMAFTVLGMLTAMLAMTDDASVSELTAATGLAMWTTLAGLLLAISCNLAGTVAGAAFASVSAELDDTRWLLHAAARSYYRSREARQMRPTKLQSFSAEASGGDLGASPQVASVAGPS